MGYFFTTFDFPAGSRMTGVWEAGADLDPDVEMVALASLVDFGPDQHGQLEANFLGSHMPFHFGGFEGVGPDGRAWAVMIQVGPSRAGDLVGGDLFWPLSDALDRGLHYNWQACLRDERGFTRDDLLHVYRRSGVEQGLIDDWTLPELVLGLLAECCYVPLDQIVVGRIAQCAFPGVDHECQHDVFRDVFARWETGQLSPPEPVIEAPEDGGAPSL